jgi:hypothetical protein
LIGSLIITSTLFLLLILGYKIFEDIAKAQLLYFAAFLPAILLLSLCNNYFFPFISAINILLVFAVIYLSMLLLRANNSNWYFYCLIAPLLYYVAGGASLMLFSVCFMLLMFFYSGYKKNIKAIIAIPVLMFAIPYLSYKFIFDIPLTHTFFEFYPDDNLMQTNYRKGTVLYLFFFSLPALLLIFSVVSGFFSREKLTIAGSLAKKNETVSNSEIIIPWYKKLVLVWTLLIITGLTVFLVYPNRSKHQNNIVKADFYCSNEKWDKAITTIFDDKNYDLKLNFLYNRAIDNAGLYLDKYFDYPQLIGASGTFPDKLNFELHYIFYSDYYYDLGYISESQQWGFKALSGFPYCPRILKRLVITSIILKDYNIAGKLLEILDDNMLSKSFVDHYLPYVSDTTLASSDKLIMTQRSLSPSDLITPTDIIDRFLDLLEKNKDNRRAYEHLQMNLLLSHQYGTFYRYLPQATNYYKTLPRIFEEALLIMKNKKAEIDKGYKISAESLKTFSGFSSIYSKFSANKETAKIMVSSYRNTLYYYTLFDSPVVTKKEPMKVNGNEYNL